MRLVCARAKALLGVRRHCLCPEEPCVVNSLAKIFNNVPSKTFTNQAVLAVEQKYGLHDEAPKPSQQAQNVFDVLVHVCVSVQ